MLEEFCERNGIEAEFIETDGSAQTAEEAAEQLDTSVTSIIKSLVFVVDGDPVLVIVRGVDQVDERRVAEVLRSEECRMARPEEVHDATGYRIGGVPPVGTDLQKVIDERVLDQDEVYGGGGSETTIVALDPRFIVDEDALVADVTV